MIKVSKAILKDIYKERPRNTRKYDYGLLVVIGGSEFYSGSPAFSAMAAFKSGVDMVRIVAPKRAADIIASFGPDLAAYPVSGPRLNHDHLSILISNVESAKAVARGKVAVVIGGGAGRSEETQAVILEFLSQASVPCIIDADAIHALSKNPEAISDKNFLITPHLQEFFVLTGKRVEGLEENEKMEIVKNEAARLHTTILLKGSTDIISDGKEVAISQTGSGLMTKGGMGDTLAGIAGAFVARGNNPFIAAQAAAYINGLAGELACQKFGESVMASDLINYIPDAIK